ncbi:MAG: hypothetical protein JXR96_13885 [Deltaproteobacteria bacterium]|nr:hypothetical protein [Deltaproteobacteria bacterium]
MLPGGRRDKYGLTVRMLAMLALLTVFTGCGETKHYGELWAFLDGQDRIHLLATWIRETEGGSLSEGHRYLPIEVKPKLTVKLPFSASTKGIRLAFDQQDRALVHTSYEYYLFNGAQFRQVSKTPGGVCPDGSQEQFQEFDGALGAWIDEGGFRILAQGIWGSTRHAVYSLTDWTLDGCSLVDYPLDHPTYLNATMSSPDPIALFQDDEGTIVPYILQDEGQGQAWQTLPGEWSTEEVGFTPGLLRTGTGQLVLLSHGPGYQFWWQGGTDDSPLWPEEPKYFAVSPRPSGGFVAASAQRDCRMLVVVYDEEFNRTDFSLQAENDWLIAIALVVREETDQGEVIHLLTAEDLEDILDYRLSPEGGLFEVVKLR